MHKLDVLDARLDRCWGEAWKITEHQWTDGPYYEIVSDLEEKYDNQVLMRLEWLS